MIDARRHATLILIFMLVGCGRLTGDIDAVVRVPAPEAAHRVLRVAASFPNGNFNAPVERIELEKDMPRRPIVVAIDACGYAVLGREFPPTAIWITLDENPAYGETMMEACLSRDRGRIETAVRSQVAFIFSRLDKIELGDRKNVAIWASGEAAPVVASMRLPVKAKVLLGDPCLIPWPSQLDNQTATAVLWTRRPQGLRVNSVEGGIDITKGELTPREIGSGLSLACSPLPRPGSPPAAYQVFIEEGKLAAMLRPSGLSEASLDFLGSASHAMIRPGGRISTGADIRARFVHPLRVGSGRTPRTCSG